MSTQLRIASITLVNFKSWYGSHTINFADRGLACIVGANGSGKSNIIDALLFVFGWRAKQLRQDRLVDLIHYSQEKPDFAKVIISFMTCNGLFDVSRTIRHNGASIYEINGQKASLDQIQTHLASQGLDVAHNRFLILQGEVESISLLKPCGEDILGQMAQEEGQNLISFQNCCEANGLSFSPVDIYAQIKQILDDNSAGKLHLGQKTVEQLTALQPATYSTASDSGLLEFIESVIGTQQYLPQLSQSMAVCDFLSEQKSQLRVKLSATVQHRDAMNDIKNEARDKIIGAGTQIREEMHQYMGLASIGRTGIQESNQRFAEKQAVINEQLAEAERVENEGNAVQARLVEEKAQLDGVVKNLDAVQQQFKANEVQLACTQEKKTSATGMLREKQAEEQEIQASVVALQQEHEMFGEQNQLFDVQIQQLEKLQQEKQQELDQLNQQQNVENEKQRQLKTEIAELEKRIQPLSAERVRLKAQHGSYEKQVTQKLQVFVDAAVKTVQDLFSICQGCQYKNSRLSTLTNKIVQLRAEAAALNEQQLKQQLEELKREDAKIKQQLSSLNLMLKENEQQKHEFETSDKLLNALLRAQEDGQLRGVHGRLGQLGQVDQNLNLAAIAAFGAQMDYIVCDSMDSIQACLSFIRQRELGIASFIDLEQVNRRFSQFYRRPGKNDAFIQHNGGHLFLDLVKTQEVYFPAFWHVMQETAVCDNVQLAMQLAKGHDGQRVRVVTLGGELFERSGSLTGGGAGSLQARFKGFRQGVQTGDFGNVRQDIQTLEASALQTSSQLQQVQARLAQYSGFAEQILQCQQNISSLQFEVQGQKAKILQHANEILRLNDNVSFRQYSVQINPMVLDELARLSEALQRAEQLWEADQYIKAIPSIIELTQYYQQQGLDDEHKFSSYIRSHDNVFLLESDESLVANIVQFQQPLSILFNTASIDSLAGKIHSIEQQEAVIRQDIDKRQEQLNQIGLTKRFKELKKHLSEIQQQMSSAVEGKSQLIVKEQQYEQKKLLLQHNAAEVQIRINEIGAEVMALEAQVQQLGAQKAVLQRSIDELNASRQRAGAAVAQSELEVQNLGKQVKIIRDGIRNLQLQSKQIQQQIEAFQGQILNSETQIVLALECLTYINEELQKIQERVDFQPPLLSTHQNQQELAEYDNYIIANYAESHKRHTIPTVQQLKTSVAQESSILLEFANRAHLLEERQREFQALSETADQQLQGLEALRQRRQSDFTTAFFDINEKLRQIYRIFSMGGDAVLEFQNHFDPFEGVLFSVMPPKKAWRQIQNLSGGEKTLSSLALIFALHQYKHNFIYVVDEIDAALDFRNVSLIANYLKEQSAECQFIIVSLRNNTFEIADRLIGVYKVDNCSEVAILDVEQ